MYSTCTYGGGICTPDDALRAFRGYHTTPQGVCILPLILLLRLLTALRWATGMGRIPATALQQQYLDP